MVRYTVGIGVLALSLAAAAASASYAQSTTPVLSIELNKLEQDGDECRFYLVIENGSDVAFAKFNTEMVFFDRRGVIVSRGTVDFAGLRPHKTHVMSFVFGPLDCTNVGRVLLNQVIECEHTAGTQLDCMDAIDVSHRGTVELVK